MATKDRQSNIELLRILTICGVVVLHYNGNIGLNHVAKGSANYYILFALEVLFICAVNLFILISGYFSSGSNKRKVIKPLELIVQVMAFGAAKYLASVVFNGGFSLWGLATSMIPNNYFVFLYVTLYLVSPYINLALDRLDQKKHGILIALCLVLFSLWPTVLDLVHTITGVHYNGMYTTNSGGSQLGYSLINFILMYLLGAYLRRYEVAKKWKTWHLALAALACVAVLYVWQLKYAQTARSYANPFVIGVGVFVFMVFQRFTIQSKLINTLAKGAFSCFLLHDMLIWHIGIPWAVTAHPVLMVGHILVTVPAIFLVSWVAWRVYDWVTAPIFRWLGKKLTAVDEFLSV